MRESKPITQFFERWLRPLLSLKPSNVSQDDFFATVLNVHSRPISGYRARRNMRLDGLLCADDVPGRPDLSPDKADLALISKGDLIWARTDDTKPTWVDVEHKGRMWQIAYRQWKEQLRPGLAPTAQGQEEL